MFRASLCFLLILFSVQYSECLPRTGVPVVDTNVGLIRGLTADDGDYDVFLGIPYAQVDQENPFGESSPQPEFKEIFEATDGSTVCPQRYSLTNTIRGTPDCLQLNIYVPSTATTNNSLPVMIWFYGGAFHTGSFGQYIYGPKYLVKHDVIVVAVNYRIGAYGFMCLDSPKIPGNQGLKDQFLGIKWVKDNIEAFGGDPDRITLFGCSAGAHAIDLHLFSETETLFNNVILQSGSSVAATVLYEPDRTAHIKIAELLGFATTDTDEAIEYLAQTDPSLVVKAAIDLNITFKPCAEKKFDGVVPFITRHWVSADVPKVKNMPVLIGYNEHEQVGNHYNKDDEYYKNLNIISGNLGRIFDFDDEELEEMINLISHFYFGDEEFSRDVQWGITNFDSDFTYLHPKQRTIKKYLEAGSGNIYYYVFSYVGGRNRLVLNEGYNNRSCCVSHGDEQSYLFTMNHIVDPTPEDRLIIEKMTTMWTNFAKYSDPTPETTELLPIKWEPLTKERYTYMNIGDELTLSSRPVHERMAFWDLFYKLNEKRQRAYEDN